MHPCREAIIVCSNSQRQVGSGGDTIGIALQVWLSYLAGTHGMGRVAS